VNENSQTLTNTDKIYSAYKGDLGEIHQSSVKERFAWIASKVNGQKILDIGCSQCIFSILLARENKNVLAIDVESEAIKFAQSLKEKEGKNVQKNVTFKNTDYLIEEVNKKFDTVIFGEVLEHLYYPKKAIEKAYNNLNKDGVIIITVPFGVNNHYDHKHTYYLTDLLELLWPYFNVKDIKFSTQRRGADWIGFFAVKRSKVNRNSFEIPLKFQKELESKMSEKENLYQNKIAKQKNTIILKNKEIQRLEKLIKTNRSSVISLKNTNNQLKSNLKQKEAALISLKNINNQLENDLKQKEADLISLKNTIHEKNKVIRKFNQRKVIRIIKKIKKMYLLPSRIFQKIKSTYFHLINHLKRKKLLKLASKMPESNGSSYFKKLDIDIGIITDEFQYNYYKDAAHLHYINFSNYKDTIDKGIDFLLFITTWVGMRGNDWKGLSSNENKRNELFQIFEYAKSQNVKVVFQSKEDPSHYKEFLPIAEKTDYIFTTDTNMLPKYKNDTGNKDVYLLEFGINPILHNPIGSYLHNKPEHKFQDYVFFAGSWYPGYPKRCEDARMIFDGIIKSQKALVIADRNSSRDSIFEFPLKYEKHIIPAIDHQILQRVHKLFKWNINLNTIRNSQTMCASRVYELQALGSLLISNYSLSVKKNFPNIFIVNTESDIKGIFDKLTKREEALLSLKSIRSVFSGNTVFDRLSFMLEKISLDKKIQLNKKILVICKEKNASIVETFSKQTYKEKTLKTFEEFKDADTTKYDFITFFKDSYSYGDNYLEDSINCFKFVDVAYVTKNGSYDSDNNLVGICQNYVNTYKDKFRTIFNIKDIKIEEDLTIKHKDNLLGYSGDAFNFSESMVPH
jgi:SAM-dependent methyltransferase